MKRLFVFLNIIFLMLFFNTLSLSQTKSVDTLKLIVFRGSANLPVFIGQDKGFFQKQNLNIEITNTPSSTFQINGIIEGKFEIGHTAADNVIAYVEKGADLFIFMGVDYGSLSLYVKPEIKVFHDLKHKTLGVDALTTGFAFVLKKILAENGLKEGDYRLSSVGGTNLRYEAMKKGTISGTLLTPPFNIMLEKDGYRKLGEATDYIKNYQASSGVATKKWAKANEDILVRYIKGYIDALNWIYGNREESIRILISKLQLPKDIAETTLENDLLNPKTGFNPRARLNLEGLKTVIELRGEMGFLNKPFPPAEKYYDLSFYNKAVGE